MKVTGAATACIDVAQEHTRDFNRWYDFDHLPENLALPEVVAARRYAAAPDCQALPGTVDHETLRDGAGAYFTLYYFGTPDLDQAERSWHALGQGLQAQGRMFEPKRVPYVGIYRLLTAQVRDDIPVRAEAAPYIAHGGVYVVLTQVADPAMRGEVNDWFAGVHAEDLLSVPGIAGAMRFHRQEEPDEGHYMNLYLLDGDAASVVASIPKHREGWMARGRSPGPGGASHILYRSGYRAIVPLEYEFKVA